MTVLNQSELKPKGGTQSLLLLLGSSQTSSGIELEENNISIHHYVVLAYKIYNLCKNTSDNTSQPTLLSVATRSLHTSLRALFLNMTWSVIIIVAHHQPHLVLIELHHLSHYEALLKICMNSSSCLEIKNILMVKVKKSEN